MLTVEQLALTAAWAYVHAAEELTSVVAKHDPTGQLLQVVQELKRIGADLGKLADEAGAPAKRAAETTPTTSPTPSPAAPAAPAAQPLRPGRK